MLEEEEEEELKDYWKALERLDPEDYESQIHRVQQIKDFKEELTAKASAQADAQLKELKDQDPGYASDSQKAQLAQYAADMEELIAKGQYKDLEPLSREWKSFAEAAAVKKPATMCPSCSMIHGIPESAPLLRYQGRFHRKLC